MIAETTNIDFYQSYFVFFLFSFFLGELSFQEYEQRVREVNTDYSNVSVGKVLHAREAEIIDIDKLIDELSDIEDLSGFSSSSENSEESHRNESSKKKKNEDEPKAKRRRQQQQQDSDENSDDDDNIEKQPSDPNEMRNKMVQYLEQMRLAKQKTKRSNEIRVFFFIEFNCITTACRSIKNNPIVQDVQKNANVLYHQ